MAKKGQQLTASRRVRPGEGVVMEGQRSVVPSASGSSMVSITVDLSSAPVPDRKYVADTGSVFNDGFSVQMCFCQRRIGRETELRSLLVIHFDYQAIANFVKANKSFVTQARAFAQAEGLPTMQLFDIVEEPTQTVALTANIMAVSHSGRDACMDLYHASPFVFHEMKNGGPFAAEPIVRVNMNTSLLVAIIAKCEELAPKLPVKTEELQ
jgi:hypothetical protein